MVKRSWSFAVALGIILLFLLLIITIVAIRATIADPNTRENGFIFLYVATAAAFFLALFAFIAAEQIPDACVLPYSGKLALYQ